MGISKASGFGPEHFEGLRKAGQAAYAEGRFLAALSTLQQAVMGTALCWFADEGVVFPGPSGGREETSLVIGLAIAAAREVEERGEGAPLRLQVAAEGLNVMAHVRTTLEQPLQITQDEIVARLSQLILLGSDLGRVDGLMHQIRLGLQDRLTELEADRERRRAGAEKTKALKASVRERALGEALRILGRNPTLGNEDVALKVRESLRLTQSVKTVTGWVRGWRQAGSLRPTS